MTRPTLHTPRLRIDALVPDDADALFAIRTDPRIAEHQGWVPATPAEAVRFIEHQGDAAFGTPGTWCQLAVRTRDDAALVGDLGVRVRADDARQAEIGFTIAPDQQRRGFAREAVTALLDHLFGELGMHRVFASVDPRNAASMALLAALGLRQEAHHRQSVWWRGAWADDVIFAVLAAEWRG